jgi:hypothetical protein
MKEKQILAVYHQGPQAMVQLVKTLCHQIQQLQVRVEQLESRTKKKTVLTVICFLLRIWGALASPYGRKLENALFVLPSSKMSSNKLNIYY